MANMTGVGNVKASSSAEIKTLLTDVRELVGSISDLKDVNVQRLRSKVQHAVDAAKESLAERAEFVRRKAQDVAESADDYIHESPWQAVGIAALVGALVGVLLTRRSLR